MNILVTGASGYIGRHLVNELTKQGYTVKALTRQPSLKIKNVKIIQGDITKPNTLLTAAKNVDAVFHNAAYAQDWGKKQDFYRFNVQGTQNIADACIKNKVKKLVYTSSAGVYGFPNTNQEITEDAQPKPFNAYQKSKLQGEKILRKYKNLNVSVIRPPLVLGGGGTASGIIIEKIKQQKMTYIGSGNQQISLVHPKDVVQCLKLALEKDTKNTVFNTVSFICTIKQLFEEIAEQIDVEPPKRHVSYTLAYTVAWFTELFSKNEPSITRYRVKSLGTNRKISCKKAKEKLGYKPKYNMQDTVKDMVSQTH